MKNKKILKALAAMAVGTVMVAGSFSMAACGGHKHTWKDGYVADGANGHYQVCQDDESHHSETLPHDGTSSCTVCGWTSSSVTPQPDEHSHNYTWVDNEDGTHTGTCANTDNKCTAVTVSNEAHDTNGTNGACSKCGYKAQGGEQGGPSVTKTTVTINMSSDLSGNVSDGTELVAGSGIYAVGDLTRNESKRDIIHPSVTDGKIVSTHRLQLGSDNAGIKIHLDADATVLIYASGSNGTTAGSLQLYEVGEEETASGDAQAIGQGGVQSDVGVAEFAVKADSDYVVKRVKNSGTLNVVFIAIHYAAISENKGELIPEVPAACEVAGMQAHYLSDYGRYYAEDGTTIKQRYQLVEAALNHDYSLVEGSVNAASATEVGSAQIKCAHEANPINVELPKLDSADYKSRPAAGVEGQYVYEYQGVQITFTAMGVAEADVVYNPLYSISTFTGVTVGNAKTDGQNCVYATEGSAVVQADGSLYIGDPEAATKVYISLGTTVTSGVVKISGSIKLGTKTGNWTFFGVTNSDNKEVVGFRTGSSSGPWGYRLSGGTLTSNTVANETSNYHDFEIIIDINKGTVTVIVDNEKLADKVAYPSNGEALNVSGIAFANINATRYLSLKNITIAKQAK